MTIQEILDSLPRKSIVYSSTQFGGMTTYSKSPINDMIDVDVATEAIKQAWNSALDLAAEGSYVCDEEPIVEVDTILNLKIK